jgi:Flp pilus assembly protein protease CpaA
MRFKLFQAHYAYQSPRTVFVVLLACTVLAGVSWLAGLTMFGASWP